MKTSKRVHTYFKHQIHLLLSILKKNEVSISDDDFHAIRIAIKRIKALFALVEKSDASFHQKKYFAPFKLVFEQAGEIRDKEVIQSMLHTHPYNASIENFEFDLQHHIDKGKKHFFQMTTSALRKDIRRSPSKLSHYLENIHHKTAQKFLEKKKKVIRKILMKDQLDPVHLHEIRKRIKDVYYVEKMINPKYQDATRTDQLQEWLGQWHDGRVLLQELNAYVASHTLSPADKTPYVSLIKRMTRENDDQFQHIKEKKQDLIKLFAS